MKTYDSYIALKEGTRVYWMGKDGKRYGRIVKVWEETSRGKVWSSNRVMPEVMENPRWVRQSADLHWSTVWVSKVQ